MIFVLLWILVDLLNAKSSSNALLPKKNLRNCSTTRRGTAHGICTTDNKRVIFTDITQKKIRSLEVECGEVTVVGRSDQDGTSDGSLMTASFTQLTGVCREENSLVWSGLADLSSAATNINS